MLGKESNRPMLSVVDVTSYGVKKVALRNLKLSLHTL